jgi:hypothetical protein
MATERKFAGKKLPLTIAFTVLLVAAFGAGCKGFFQPPTLTSLNISPTSPTVLLGSTTSVSAFAVNSNGEGSTLTSGVSWSSGTPSVAAITGACATGPCGGATVSGLAIGTSVLTASIENVTNTATLTVFINVSSMTIAPQSQTISQLGGTTSSPYIVTVQPGSVDISSSATLTPYLNGTQSSNVTCVYDVSEPNGGSGGPGIYCTDNDTGATGSYQLIATYTGTSVTATASLSVQ